MNISPTKTKYKRIPIADCPKCGEKDAPLSQEHKIFKHKDTGEELDVWFVSCSKCGNLFNWDEESMKQIKGYISIRDLKTLGYKQTEAENE